MTSPTELERLVRPSDLRHRRPLRRRRGWFGTLADTVVAAFHARG
ncbi:hypothetical protein [Paractinoplanes maris]|nr:hypothetical protein [Actinoplanes maris]